MNGQFEDYTTEEQFVELVGSYDDSILGEILLGASFHQENFERNDGIPISPEIGHSRSKKPAEEEKGNPYSKKLFNPEMEKAKFIISNDIQERIFSNIMIKDVVRSIETKLRGFSIRFPKMTFSINVKNDEEIPTWEKIIIGISFPSLEINRKLELWDKIDSEIRAAVLDAGRKVDGSDETELKKFNKKLYVHLEL